MMGRKGFSKARPSRLPLWFWGELLGTFILVFVGLGAVALATTAPGTFPGVFPVAMVWGLGLAVAIILTGRLSGAHLNPAISIAFCVFTEFPARRLPGYVAAQFLGAFAAAALVYLIYGGFIEGYERENRIQRGQAGSEATAMIFGEYYPNPGGEALGPDARIKVSLSQALLAEGVGTFLLAAGVLAIVGLDRSGPGVSLGPPLMIGLLLATLICLFGPVTMACFNPARDLAPRLFSALAGWRTTPFSANGFGWPAVYLLAPCLGALLGAATWRRLECRLDGDLV